MRILFIGYKDRGVKCLEALIKAGHNIVAIITDKKHDPHKFWKESVEEKAKEHGLPVYIPLNINDSQFIEKIKSWDIDLMAMSGYGQILSKEIIQIPPKGVINLHAGKLPEYRGGCPLNWAIINGETEAYATIHYCSEALDSGPILAQKKFSIGVEETIKEIQEKTLEIFPEMLLGAIEEIQQGIQKPVPQDFAKAIYYCSRKPEDGKIDWEKMTAKNVYDFVRALTHPFPGAFCFLDGKKVYIWKASLLQETIRHFPGRVCMRRGEGRVVIAKDRGLLVDLVQFEGDEKKTAAKVFKKGIYLK